MRVKIRVSIVFLLMLALLLVSGCGEQRTDVFEQGQSIEMTITGGFVAIHRKIEIRPTDAGIQISDQSDFPQPHMNHRLLSTEEQEKLWQTLLENDVFELPTNVELTRSVADAFFYEVAVRRGPMQHEFSVYAPEILASDRDEPRYEQITHAILELATF